MRRRWDGSVGGGGRMAVFCLGAVSSGMDAHNGLHSRSHQQHHDVSLLRPDSVREPHPPAPRWDFQSIFLQAGRCHSARPSSNPSVGTSSKISVKLTQRKKILPCLFCLSFLLCYVVESLLRNQSGFFLTCLDIFCFFLTCFLTAL